MTRVKNFHTRVIIFITREEIYIFLFKKRILYIISYFFYLKLSIILPNISSEFPTFAPANTQRDTKKVLFLKVKRNSDSN